MSIINAFLFIGLTTYLLTHLVARNIETYRRTERDLRESEERYRQLFENAPDAIFVSDGNTYAFANDAALRLVGATTPEQVLGKPVLSFVCPDSWEMAKENTRILLENRTVIPLSELCVVRLDGSVIDVEIVGTSIFSQDKPAIQIIARDITGRKRMESDLRETATRLNKAQEIAHLGSWEFDIVHNILTWSDEVYRIFGFEPGEFQGTYEGVMEAVHPDDRATVDDAYFGALREGRDTVEIEHRIVRRSTGEIRYLHEKCEHVRDEAGRIVRSVGMVHDITDRKLAQEERERLIVELQRSNRELQQFAYISSHDLQEPLRLLTMYSDLLRRRYEGTLDAKAEKYLSHIFEAAIRMSALITDVLAFSQIGSGKQQSFHPVEMESVLTDVLQNLTISIREGEAEIRHDPLPQVLGIRSQLTQLLQNLISNALKFRRKEVTPVVLISLERQGDQWVFGVHDNGIGIDEEFFDKIFIIFQRLHLREEYPGTGMGLAICRKIVEQHRGRIWVTSRLGEGSSFFFSLPAGKA